MTTAKKKTTAKKAPAKKTEKPQAPAVEETPVEESAPAAEEEQPDVEAPAQSVDEGDLSSKVSVRAMVSLDYPADAEPEIFESGGAGNRSYRVTHITASRTLGGHDDSTTRYSGRAALIKADGTESAMQGSKLSYGYVPAQESVRNEIEKALDAALAKAAGK